MRVQLWNSTVETSRLREGHRRLAEQDYDAGEEPGDGETANLPAPLTDQELLVYQYETLQNDDD